MKYLDLNSIYPGTNEKVADLWNAGRCALIDEFVRVKSGKQLAVKKYFVRLAGQPAALKYPLRMEAYFKLQFDLTPRKVMK